MRGTWQGSGTWKSSGPDLSGLLVPVVLAAVAFAVVEFILSIIVWLAIGAGVVLVAAVGALIWWKLKVAPKRKARYDAMYAAAFAAERERAALTGTVIPPVSGGTTPVIENHYHVHLHAARPEPVRIIRAIPGDAGEAITEE